MKNRLQENKTKKVSFGYLLRNYAWPLRKAIFLLIFISFIANFITASQPIVFAGIMNIIIGQSEVGTVQKTPKLLDLNQIGNHVMDFLNR